MKGHHQQARQLAPVVRGLEINVGVNVGTELRLVQFELLLSFHLELDVGGEEGGPVGQGVHSRADVGEEEAADAIHDFDYPAGLLSLEHKENNFKKFISFSNKNVNLKLKTK